MRKFRIPEFRADLKSLTEQRNDKVTELQVIVDKAKEETRAMTEEEVTKFNTLEKEIKNLDTTIKAEERARDLKIIEDVKNKKPEERAAEERAIAEERAFENYIRGVVEERADVNLTVGDNGAVIPSSIANKIIKKVYDISPIYQLATRYNIGGTLSIPYYDEESQSITMDYAEEFEELTSTSGKFTSIQLKGFLAGVLTKVSKSLINNSQFAIVPFVVNAMAESIARWIEKELLQGTDNKIEGLKGVTQIVTTASATAVTADELIDIQEEVPDVFQGSAIWVMNKATRKAIRKLKDGDGTYLLQKDFNAKWGYTLLGKDVYTTDNMAGIEAGKDAIFYGDFSGLAVKLTEDMTIDVLREKFATQHAVGLVGWLEMDSKVENAQKIAKLTLKGA